MRAVLLLLLLVGAEALAQPSASRDSLVAVDVDHIPRRALLTLLADIAGINVVVGDELRDDDVDLRDSAGARTLVKRFAAAQGLAVREENGIVLVASSCRLERKARVGDHAKLREPMTAMFQFVDAAEAMSIISDFAEVRFEAPQTPEPSTLTIAVRDHPVWQQLRAIARVQGWKPTPAGGASIRFGNDPAVEKCKVRSPGPGSKIARPFSGRSSACAPGVADERPCMPLEAYDLAELQFRGVVADAARGRRVAVVTVPDARYVYSAAVGDYLGRHGGRVVKILDDRVQVSEPAAGGTGETTAIMLRKPN